MEFSDTALLFWYKFFNTKYYLSTLFICTLLFFLDFVKILLVTHLQFLHLIQYFVLSASQTCDMPMWLSLWQCVTGHCKSRDFGFIEPGSFWLCFALIDPFLKTHTLQNTVYTIYILISGFTRGLVHPLAWDHWKFCNSTCMIVVNKLSLVITSEWSAPCCTIAGP